MDSFAILGLQVGASKSEVVRAYRRLAVQLHPDKAGPDSTAKFQRMQNAFERIRDKELWDKPGQQPSPHDNKPAPRRKGNTDDKAQSNAKRRSGAAEAGQQQQPPPPPKSSHEKKQEWQDFLRRWEEQRQQEEQRRQEEQRKREEQQPQQNSRHEKKQEWQDFYRRWEARRQREEQRRQEEQQQREQQRQQEEQRQREAERNLIWRQRFRELEQEFAQLQQRFLDRQKCQDTLTGQGDPCNPRYVRISNCARLLADLQKRAFFRAKYMFENFDECTFNHNGCDSMCGFNQVHTAKCIAVAVLEVVCVHGYTDFAVTETYENLGALMAHMTLMEQLCPGNLWFDSARAWCHPISLMHNYMIEYDDIKPVDMLALEKGWSRFVDGCS